VKAATGKRFTFHRKQTKFNLSTITYQKYHLNDVCVCLTITCDPTIDPFNRTGYIYISIKKSELPDGAVEARHRFEVLRRTIGEPKETRVETRRQNYVEVSTAKNI
jgi:hypothetical protein